MFKTKNTYATRIVVENKDRSGSKIASAETANKLFNKCSFGNIVGEKAIITSGHVNRISRTDIGMLPAGFHDQILRKTLEN